MAETVSSINNSKQQQQQQQTTVISSETSTGHQNAKLVLGAKPIKSTRTQWLPSGRCSALNTSQQMLHLRSSGNPGGILGVRYHELGLENLGEVFVGEEIFILGFRC